MNRKTQKRTVTSKNPNVSFSGEKIEEERDYVNTAACTENKISATSDKKSPSFTRSFLPIAVCWVILLIIMALRIHFTTVISENNAKLIAENQNLTAENQNLIAETQNLTAENQNLTAEIQNLTAENQNLTAEIQNLTAENQNLTAEIQNLTEENNKLNTQNQELETQKNNLKEQIPRQCKACESGWLHYQSSCYLINNTPPPNRKTWEEAQNNCRGRNSDLAVIVNEDEKRFINEKSWRRSGVNGYWIGLRVEDGRWKWIDGSDLTESSWVQQPPTNGQCAISVHNEGWKSVNCGLKNAWICKKKALSV